MNSIAKLTAIAVVIGQLVGGPAATAQDLDYDVFVEGKRIGSMTVSTREVGGTAVEVTARTKLRVKALFMTVFSLDSQETNLIGAAGLLRHTSRSTIDGEQVTVSGVRGDSVFTLEVGASGTTETWVIDLAAFDRSSIEGPNAERATPGATQRYRVLDLDRLEIVDRLFTWAADETVLVDGRPVECRVVDMSDAFGHSRSWIARDTFQTLIKEEGTDEDGHFRIVLTHYPIELGGSSASSFNWQPAAHVQR